MPEPTPIMTHEEYGEVYQQGFLKTVRMLRCRGASPDVAEDVAQTAWLQGWRKLQQLRDKAALVGWINTIAVNFHRRNGSYESRYQALPEEIRGTTGIDCAPLDVAKILQMCGPGERQLFEHQLGGLTTEEIAEKQGASPGAIRLRLLRARRAVRTHLQNPAVLQTAA